jgi:hypothetical protein
MMRERKPKVRLPHKQFKAVDDKLPSVSPVGSGSHWSPKQKHLQNDLLLRAIASKEEKTKQEFEDMTEESRSYFRAKEEEVSQIGLRRKLSIHIEDDEDAPRAALPFMNTLKAQRRREKEDEEELRRRRRQLTSLSNASNLKNIVMPMNGSNLQLERMREDSAEEDRQSDSEPDEGRAGQRRNSNSLLSTCPDPYTLPGVQTRRPARRKQYGAWYVSPDLWKMHNVGDDWVPHQTYTDDTSFPTAMSTNASAATSRASLRSLSTSSSQQVQQHVAKSILQRRRDSLENDIAKSSNPLLRERRKSFVRRMDGLHKLEREHEGGSEVAVDYRTIDCAIKFKEYLIENKVPLTDTVKQIGRRAPTAKAKGETEPAKQR